jgi:hypothetical protein
VSPATAARAEAQHDVLRTALAACRFRIHHQRLPGDLAELVPALIPAVPRDPFDGKPPRMKKSAGKLVVYSVGPDMVDHGGTPFDRDKRVGDITFVLREQPTSGATVVVDVGARQFRGDSIAIVLCPPIRACPFPSAGRLPSDARLCCEVKLPGACNEKSSISLSSSSLP